MSETWGDPGRGAFERARRHVDRRDALLWSVPSTRSRSARFVSASASCCCCPLPCCRDMRWPARRDWPAVDQASACCSLPHFRSCSTPPLIFTTAAREARSRIVDVAAARRMAVGAALGSEQLTLRKTAGVLVDDPRRRHGPALRPANAAPEGAWRGDLLMVAAALCMALYSIWSKPFIRRSGPIPFTTMAMAAGAGCLVTRRARARQFRAGRRLRCHRNGSARSISAPSELRSTFYLWAFALERTTPTRVAISVTVNPIAASLVGATLLGEPLRWNLVVGIVTVFAGIWIATTQSGSSKIAEPRRSGGAGGCANGTRRYLAPIFAPMRRSDVTVLRRNPAAPCVVDSGRRRDRISP